MLRIRVRMHCITLTRWPCQWRHATQPREPSSSIETGLVEDAVVVKRTFSRVVGPLVVAWFALNLYRASLPVLLPEFRRLYGIEYGDAGVVFGLLFAGLALSQLPSGLLADAVGDVRVMGTSIVGASLTLALFGATRSLLGFGVLAFTFGVFVGGFRSVAISAVTKKVPATESGSALGLMASGNPLGNLVGPVVTAAAVLSLGVSQTPLALGLVGVVLSVGVWWLLATGAGQDGGQNPQGVERGEATSAIGETRGRLSLVVRTLSTRRAILVVFVSLAFSAAWQGVFTFLPSFLVETKGLDLGRTGLITGITFGVGILFNVGAGRLADRIGHERVMFGGLVVSSSGLLLLPSAGEILSVVAILVVFSAGLSSIPPARDAFIGSLAPAADRGSVVGGVRTVYILLASGVTVVTGTVIEYAGFTAGFRFLAVLLLLGVTAGFGLVRQNGAVTQELVSD